MKLPSGPIRRSKPRKTSGRIHNSELPGDDIENDTEDFIEDDTEDDRIPADTMNKSRFLGRTIDRYKVSEVLGEGAYAWVLKARHVMLDRDVAMKVLKPLGDDMETVKQRFLAEGRVISRLKHPNIVEVYDFGETEDGLLYMCLEYLDGQDLRDYLRDHPDRSLENCTSVVVEILKSLQAAHEFSVVHRDLKPENVFLVNDGSLRVLDFGIAKVVQDTQSSAGSLTTKDGSFLGTPKYCAPEQALGQDTGPFTDIYGVALIYYEMLTGNLPFSSQNALGYLTLHASGKPTAPSCFRPDLPVGVEQAILRALNKKPEQRYPSAQSFIDALEEYLPYPEETSR